MIMTNPKKELTQQLNKKFYDKYPEMYKIIEFEVLQYEIGKEIIVNPKCKICDDSVAKYYEGIFLPYKENDIEFYKNEIDKILEKHKH